MMIASFDKNFNDMFKNQMLDRISRNSEHIDLLSTLLSDETVSIDELSKAYLKRLFEAQVLFDICKDYNFISESDYNFMIGLNDYQINLIFTELLRKRGD